MHFGSQKGQADLGTRILVFFGMIAVFGMVFIPELMRIPLFLVLVALFYIPARMSQSYFRYEELYVGAWGYFFIFMGLSFLVGFPSLFFYGWWKGWLLGEGGEFLLGPMYRFGGSFRFSLWKIEWYPFRHFTIIGMNLFAWTAAGLGSLIGALREWDELEAFQGLYNERVFKKEKSSAGSYEILSKEDCLEVHEIQDGFALINFSKFMADWQFKVDGLFELVPQWTRVVFGVLLLSLFSYGIYILVGGVGSLFLSKDGVLRFISLFVALGTLFAGLYLRTAESLMHRNDENVKENERCREVLLAERQKEYEARSKAEQEREAQEREKKAKAEAAKKAAVQAEIDEQLRKKYIAAEPPLKPKKDKSKKPGFWDDDKGDF
jgi:hypothetical protein